MGEGDWNYWHGESGDTSGNVSALIPRIISSDAGQALKHSGFHLDEAKLLGLQSEAQILCNRHQDDVFPCDPSEAPCLFHVEDDPCELWNVAGREPYQVQRLVEMISQLNKTALPSMNRLRHPEGFPRHWGNIWTTWEDNIDALRLKNALKSNASSNNLEIPYGTATLLLLFALIVIIVNS